MCGFAGVIGFHGLTKKVLMSMADSISYRGPDDSGCWIDSAAGVGFSHRRLSIMDLSVAGHQPMSSPCGRFVLVFNGEIYGHEDMRKELEIEGGAFDWSGQSDTETLLAAFRHWGVVRTLQKINGMFALALWSANTNQVILARDRFGEKPLYYGCVKKSFIFGSELKALKLHPDWAGVIDREALALFMRYSHIPTPHSIYHDIKKLPAAHYLVVSNQGQNISEPICYWSLADVARRGIALRKGGAAELTEELDWILKDAVGLRMLSDVSLGAFLSGGYDSTMIVAQMQSQSMQPVRTFSIGNQEEEFDEARYASAVANHLGTDHTEFYVSANDALSVIPRLSTIYDEPFADSSQIPSFLVSQLARQNVKVVLSGDGGDELFAGYNRHVVGVKLWAKLGKLPSPARRAICLALKALGTPSFTRLSDFIGHQLQVPDFNFKLAKLGSSFGARDGIEFYDLLKAHWSSSSVVLGVSDFLDPTVPRLDGADFLDQMLFMDSKTYLPDDILTKVDRATMAVGLEARVPFLDYRLAEFAWGVPSELKVKDGAGKWLLREVLNRYVPRDLMERPKQGFSIPIGEWLRGPLREWAEALLDSNRLHREGFLDVGKVRSSWEGHLAGRGHEEHKLWCSLMFQAWLESQESDTTHV